MMEINQIPEKGDDAAPYGPTLLRMLIIQRHWQKFTAFESQFRRAAAELAEREDEPRLRKVTVSRRQFERWYAGKVKTEPYPDACRVLEHMFGWPVQQLLAPVSDTPESAETGGIIIPQHRVSSRLISIDAILQLPLNSPLPHATTTMPPESPGCFWPPL